MVTAASATSAPLASVTSPVIAPAVSQTQRRMLRRKEERQGTAFS